MCNRPHLDCHRQQEFPSCRVNVSSYNLRSSKTQSSWALTTGHCTPSCNHRYMKTGQVRVIYSFYHTTVFYNTSLSSFHSWFYWVWASLHMCKPHAWNARFLSVVFGTLPAVLDRRRDHLELRETHFLTSCKPHFYGLYRMLRPNCQCGT